MIRYVIIGVLLVLIFCSPAFSGDTQYIGIIPFYAPEKIWTLYAPFIDYLNAATEIKWALKLYPNHNAIIEDICKGEISFSFLGPVPFGRAYEKCRVKPLLVAMGKDGKPSYTAIIITNDNALGSLGSVRGRKIGFFEGSTAAYVMPRKMLEEAGIDLEMIRPVFLKGQDKLIEALLKREIDAAGVKESLFEKFRDSGLKVLKISEPMPNFVFCSSPSLRQNVEKIFVEALLKVRPLTNPDHRKIVDKWDEEIKHGFIVPPKTFVDDAVRLSNLFKKYEK